MPTKCELETSRKERILTDEDISEIESMYKSGKYYVKEIGEWLGVSASTIHYWLKKRGLK